MSGSVDALWSLKQKWTNSQPPASSKAYFRQDVASKISKRNLNRVLEPTSCLHSVNLHHAEVSLAKSVNICQLHDSSLSLSQG